MLNLLFCICSVLAIFLDVRDIRPKSAIRRLKGRVDKLPPRQIHGPTSPNRFRRHESDGSPWVHTSYSKKEFPKRANTNPQPRYKQVVAEVRDHAGDSGFVALAIFVFGAGILVSDKHVDSCGAPGML